MSAPRTTLLSRPTRRGLLGTAAATLLGAGLAGTTTVARAEQPAAEPRRATFAVVTDTHINHHHPERTTALARVMEHIHGRDPGFLVNCGDITDNSLREDFELYLSCIPDGLRSKAHHVPGNHEVQWNADAMSAYHEIIGPTRFSLDHGGLHILGLDPLRTQQWSWQFGAELLDFVADDLRGLADDTPVVVMNHFPLRLGGQAYVQDSDDFIRLIESHPVRAVFGGHTHNRAVSQWNGVTQLIGSASVKEPVYYWAEDIADVDGERILQVSEVLVPPDGAATEEVVAGVRLDGPGPGTDLRPTAIEMAVEPDAVRVHVAVPATAPVGQVYARLDPQGGQVADWTRLDQDQQDWTGEVDIGALPPGAHNLIIRSGRGDGVTHDSTVDFAIEPGRTRVAWQRSLDAPVQGGIAADGARIMIGTLSGQVTALDVTAQHGRRRWTRSVGGAVLRAPVFSPDAESVLIGSSDNHLSSLDRNTGRVRWRTDLGDPVTGDLTIGEVDGEPRALAAAGTRLCCLDLSGAVLWRAELGERFAGQAACDGERIYAASGDGHAYAFAARTGERLWRQACTDRGPDEGRLAHSPWAARIRMFDDGDVLLTTFSSALALDAATGEVRWSFDELHRGLYTPPTITEQGVLVFDGRDGIAYLLDQSTGEPVWHDTTVSRSFGAAPVPRADGTLLMVANNGLLVEYDLTRPRATALLQVSRTFTTSTPALVTDDDGTEFLVTVAKDGRLSAVTGLRGDTDD